MSINRYPVYLDCSNFVGTSQFKCVKKWCDVWWWTSNHAGEVKLLPLPLKKFEWAEQSRWFRNKRAVHPLFSYWTSSWVAHIYKNSQKKCCFSIILLSEGVNSVPLTKSQLWRLDGARIVQGRASCEHLVVPNQLWRSKNTALFKQNSMIGLRRPVNTRS